MIVDGSSPPAISMTAIPGSVLALSRTPVIGVPVVINFGGSVKPYVAMTMPTTPGVSTETGGFDGDDLGANPGPSEGGASGTGEGVGGGGSVFAGVAPPVEDVIPIVWETPPAGYDPEDYPNQNRIYPLRRSSRS